MAARLRIVIAGELQCLLCSQVSLVADHLSRNLPSFCYETVLKPVSEWEAWLRQMNSSHKWHHLGSPLVWKELLMTGSKPYYIGGASEFWEYCHAYYNLDVFISEKIFNDLENGVQYEKKLKAIRQKLHPCGDVEVIQNGFVICISGAGHESTPHLISGILDVSDASTGKKVSKIFLFDEKCYEELKALEKDSCNILMPFPHRAVRAIEKLGVGLVEADLLIVMDHEPYREDLKIKDWLDINYQKMKHLAEVMNTSASPTISIIFPNFGPSCFNATVLLKATNHIDKNNIVVSTSDLGLEIMVSASEIADIPLHTMFCPPVWGFVGINHIVDMRTAHHKYYSFYPYERIVKTRDSTLKVGAFTPEIRNLEYLTLWDRSLWLKVTERKKEKYGMDAYAHAIEALVGSVKLWFFDSSPNKFTNLGVACNGSFGLTLDGIFSQPVQLLDGHWQPATDLFPMPRDPYVKIHHFEETARALIENHINKNMLAEKFAKALIDKEIAKSVSVRSFTYDILDEAIGKRLVCNSIMNMAIDEARQDLTKSTYGMINEIFYEAIPRDSWEDVSSAIINELMFKAIQKNSSEELQKSGERIYESNEAVGSSDSIETPLKSAIGIINEIVDLTIPKEDSENLEQLLKQTLEENTSKIDSEEIYKSKYSSQDIFNKEVVSTLSSQEKFLNDRVDVEEI